MRYIKHSRKSLRIGITCLAILLIGLSSCNKNDIIEGDPEPPKIVLGAGDTGVYQLKTGRNITLNPTVENADGAVYTWIRDENPVGSQNSYTFSENTPGEYYVTFRVTTPSGEDSEEFRIDVLDPAPPVISFGLADGKLNVLAGSEFVFSPIVLNGEEARFEWQLDGTAAGSGTSYTFSQTELKEYRLTLAVVNEDGSDEAAIRITVCDELPLNVFFDKPMFIRESTDIHVFAGQKVCLWPIVEGGTALTYRWFADGQELPDVTGESYTVYPEAGETVYTVTVTSGDAENSGFTSVSASVKVQCAGAEPAIGRASSAGSSAYSSRVYEYIPAPGQFINETLSGFNGENSFEAAAAYAERRLAERNYLSLGGFGGSVTVGFDHSIPNKGGYNGYDFAIEDNSFDGSSEPGIVWVMQDVNGNGLPDDVWYELKGSETGKPGTLQRYAVTYVRPAGERSPVPWRDNRGNTGQVSYVSYHQTQTTYYPVWIASGAYTLRGTCLENNAYASGYDWILPAREWGYADNLGNDRMTSGESSLSRPSAVCFKIDNAVLADGSAARLRYIDFVKIQTGLNAQCGWLGEISTEVCSVQDLNLGR